MPISAFSASNRVRVAGVVMVLAQAAPIAIQAVGNLRRVEGPKLVTASGGTSQSAGPDPKAWVFLVIALLLCLAAYGLVRMWRAAIVVTYVLEAIIVIVAAVHTVIVASVVTLLVGVLVIGLLASTRRRDRPALVVGP